MKKQFSGSFEHSGVEYDYTVVIYSGDDAGAYPDRITDLDRADREPVDEEIWEEVETAALQNAYLVEWCEREGWNEEDTGGGCSALIKTGNDGTVTRITKAGDPSVPQTMGEPVAVGRYDTNDQRFGETHIFEGGINEWITDPSVSNQSPYADTIREVAERLGRPNVNPRWIEAFMRLEYPSLNGVSKESFNREVAVGIACIDAVGPKKAEQCAKSAGL